jgi:hypothetical protein
MTYQPLPPNPPVPLYSPDRTSSLVLLNPQQLIQLIRLLRQFAIVMRNNLEFLRFRFTFIAQNLAGAITSGVRNVQQFLANRFKNRVQLIQRFGDTFRTNLGNFVVNRIEGILGIRDQINYALVNFNPQPNLQLIRLLRQFAIVMRNNLEFLRFRFTFIAQNLAGAITSGVRNVQQFLANRFINRVQLIQRFGDTFRTNLGNFVVNRIEGILGVRDRVFNAIGQNR